MPLGLRSFREAQQAAAEERRMRFSVWPGPMQTWGSVLELARHAEDTGWDGAGTSHELTQTLSDYREAGVDEFIVPDFHLGGGPDRIEFYDRFISEVVAPVRD